jgi:hypothetical protein
MSASWSTKRRKGAKIAKRLAVCAFSGKLCYPSRKRALGALNNTRAHHARGKASGSAPVAVYRCSCGSYHMTSQVQRNGGGRA